jgi:hypothetical protein
MLQVTNECYNMWNEHMETDTLQSEWDIYSHFTFSEINIELLICASGKDLGDEI